MHVDAHHGLADRAFQAAWRCHSSGNILVHLVVALHATSVVPTASGRWLARGSKFAGCLHPIARSSLQGAEVLRVEDHLRIEGRTVAAGAERRCLKEADCGRPWFDRGRELFTSNWSATKHKMKFMKGVPLTCTAVLFLVLVVIVVQHFLEFRLELLEERHLACGDELSFQ